MPSQQGSPQSAQTLEKTAQKATAPSKTVDVYSPQDPFDAKSKPIEYPDIDSQVARMLAASATTIPEATTAYLFSTIQPVENVGGENPEATVLVIDNFDRDEEGHNHGETVVDVMKRAGLKDSDIQRVSQPRGPIEITELLNPGLETPKKRIDSFIELSALEMISSTQNAIEQKVQSPGSKIKTISHSIGTQAFDIGFSLLNSAVKFDPENGKPEMSIFGKHIFEGLGLKPDLSKESLRTLHKTALQRAHSVISNSPKVQKARAEFDEQLGELKSQGVSYFRSAGNAQDTLSAVQEVMSLDDSATYSLLSVPNANLVGALDTKGTPDPSDDVMAEFSTLDPNVKYLANGVNIESRTPAGIKLTEGTSFSAPFVAANSELARRNGLELHQLPNAHNHSSGPLAIL